MTARLRKAGLTVAAVAGLLLVGLVNPLLGALALGLICWRRWGHATAEPVAPAPAAPFPPPGTERAAGAPTRTEPEGLPWFRPGPPPGSVLGPRRISKTVPRS